MPESSSMVFLGSCRFRMVPGDVAILDRRGIVRSVLFNSPGHYTIVTGPGTSNPYRFDLNRTRATATINIGTVGALTCGVPTFIPGPMASPYPDEETMYDLYLADPAGGGTIGPPDGSDIMVVFEQTP